MLRLFPCCAPSTTGRDEKSRSLDLTAETDDQQNVQPTELDEKTDLKPEDALERTITRRSTDVVSEPPTPQKQMHSPSPTQARFSTTKDKVEEEEIEETEGLKVLEHRLTLSSIGTNEESKKDEGEFGRQMSGIWRSISATHGDEGKDEGVKEDGKEEAKSVKGQSKEDGAKEQASNSDAETITITEQLVSRPTTPTSIGGGPIVTPKTLAAALASDSDDDDSDDDDASRKSMSYDDVFTATPLVETTKPSTPPLKTSFADSITPNEIRTPLSPSIYSQTQSNPQTPLQLKRTLSTASRLTRKDSTKSTLSRMDSARSTASQRASRLNAIQPITNRLSIVSLRSEKDPALALPSNLPDDIRTSIITLSTSFEKDHQALPTSPSSSSSRRSSVDTAPTRTSSVRSRRSKISSYEAALKRLKALEEMLTPLDTALQNLSILENYALWETAMSYRRGLKSFVATGAEDFFEINAEGEVVGVEEGGFEKAVKEMERRGTGIVGELEKAVERDGPKRTTALPSRKFWEAKDVAAKVAV